MTKDGKEEVVVTDENAQEIARQEVISEKKTKEEEGDLYVKPEPEKKPDELEQEPEKDPKEGEETVPQEKADEDLLKADLESLNDEEKAKREELVEAQKTERDRLLNIPEADLSDEDRKSKETVILQLETEEKEKFDEKVTVYAKEKDIPEGDARKRLEKIGVMQKKYDNDPFKLAEGVEGMQHLVAQKDKEIAKVKEEANAPKRPQSAREWAGAIQEQGLVVNGRHHTYEQVVDVYRGDNKDLTEGMEDEQVLMVIAKDIHARSEGYYKEQAIETKGKANDKRKELVSKIPEKDSHFKDTVKELLNNVDDVNILNENYSLAPSLQYARGGYYNEDKVAQIRKEAEEKGFKRGQSSGKIVTGVIGTGNQPSKKSVTAGLTEAQKEEALGRFPDSSEDEAYEMYADIVKSRKKKK